MRATLVQDLPPWMMRQSGAIGSSSSSTSSSSVADDGTAPSQAVSVEAGGLRLRREGHIGAGEEYRSGSTFHTELYGRRQPRIAVPHPIAVTHFAACGLLTAPPLARASLIAAVALLHTVSANRGASRPEQDRQAWVVAGSSSSCSCYCNRIYAARVVSKSIPNVLGLVPGSFLKSEDLAITLNYLGGTPFKFTKPSIVINAFLLAAHLVSFAKMVFASFFQRQLAFNSPRLSNREEGNPSGSGGRTKAFSVNLYVCISKQPLVAYAMALAATFSSKFGKHGLFGIHGKYYDRAYTLVVVASIVFRAFQVWTVSNLVSRLWINRLFSSTVALNCASIPLMNLLVPESQLQKRMALLLMDALLDFMTSAVIPTAIFAPYLLEFDTELGDFPFVDYYHDTWFIQAVSENRQAFARSWLDLVAKNYPKATFLFTIELLKACIARSSRRRRVTRSGYLQRNEAVLFASNVVLPSGPEGPSVIATKRRPFSLRTTTLHKGWCRRFFSSEYWARNGIFILCGVAVLGIHIQTISVARDGNCSACLLETRPWFASAYHCAVVEVICGRHPLSDGLAGELDAFLAGMQPSAVQGLIFSSCPKLQMPPIIAQFSNLVVIKIYNCTIDTWDGQATFTGANHPAVQLVYIVNTNMSDVPRGLLSDDFPPMLTDIEFSGTNLTRLPSEISTKWSRLNFFILEGSSGVSEVPAPLAALQIAKMSLSSNNITSIPDELLSNQIFWMLKLANNPLRRLPEQIGDISKMYQFDISHTLMADLPAWLKTNSSSVTGNTWGTDGTHPGVIVDLKAGGSGLCMGDEQSAPESKVNPLFQLNCTEDPSMSSKYLYPIEAEIQWRKY